jgi:predicted DNA binding CopG/RHH family protein
MFNIGCRDFIYMQNESKILVNVRMKRSIVEEMKVAAEKLDIPYSQFIRLAIKEKLAKKEKVQ